MEIELKENERIDDLQLNGLKIIQNKDGFCFGIDSVLLSDFAKDIPANSRVLDLGTGTGILGILLCGKTHLSEIYGVDIQEEVCEMASRSIRLNNLEDRFKIINKNIKDLNTVFEENSFDVVISNPPYKKDKSGLKNESETKLISRHEISASLEDFIKGSSKLLKYNGNLYMVHRPERLSDLFCLLRNYNLEPKKLRLVYSYANSKPKLILVKATKNAKSFLNIDEPLIIYNKDGSYTDEIFRIYGKKGVWKCLELYT